MMNQRINRYFVMLFLTAGAFFNPAYADNSVLSSKSLSNMASQNWVEPFVQEVVFNSYQRFVRESARAVISQRVPLINAATAEQVVMQATAQGLEIPDVMATIKDVYLLGVQEAVDQIKRKATQSVLQKEVENLVNRAMNRLRVYPSFQQIIEQQVQWAKNIQTHRNIQQSYQQQQVQMVNQQQDIRRQVEAQQKQMQEKLEKAMKGKKP